MRGLLLLAAAVAVAGCGRVGPVRPPGPASEVVYPRLYPTLPQDRRTAPAAQAPVEQGNLPINRPASPQ